MRYVLLIRGRPFDSEGGGGLALLVGTDYLFSSRAWPEKQQTKKKGGGGWVLVRGLS